MAKKRNMNDIQVKELKNIKIQFNKWLNLVHSFQDQTKGAVDKVLDQSDWVPDEGRKAVHSWLDACQAGRDRFKKYVDDSFTTMEQFLTPGDSGSKGRISEKE